MMTYLGLVLVVLYVSEYLSAHESHSELPPAKAGGFYELAGANTRDTFRISVIV